MIMMTNTLSIRILTHINMLTPTCKCIIVPKYMSPKAEQSLDSQMVSELNLQTIDSESVFQLMLPTVSLIARLLTD